MKSNLDLVNECDNFPYYENNPKRYINFLSSYWEFHLRGGGGPHGLIADSIVTEMPFNESWLVENQPNKRVTVHGPGDQEQIIKEILETARGRDIFRVLRGWRSELYPVHGHRDSDADTISMERAGTALFGINTYGVHMTMYTKTSKGMQIWVPRRAKSKQTYGGMLDNSVAGGLSTGEIPIECMIREAAEEASLPEELVRANAKPCGTVSYVHVRDERAGGEIGLIQPECQYVYDLEVQSDVVPRPGDNEVEDFYLWTIDEVRRSLAAGEFKPNCAAVLLDFFVRHGILTPEVEPHYIEIVSRLHRKLPFPTSQENLST
ncbi:hypothetical protein ACLMJK_003479 [Lecanora helva]